MPDTIGELVTKNPAVFYESYPDIDSINKYLRNCIATHSKNEEKKLTEKVSHISVLSGISVQNLQNILYDNEKIIDVRVINWLPLKSKLFIFEVMCEVPVIRYQFLKRYKTQTIKRNYYFLDIGLTDCSVL